MIRKKKTTISTLLRQKQEGRRIAVLTCYDYSTARVMEQAGIDAILVGDTYGEVCLGHDTTLPVTVDHLVTITAAVRRGAPSTFLIGDMPYLSYQVSHEDAIRNAGRFMAEAGCDCVKIEVDGGMVDTVRAMTRATIPVMAHLGLRPQSIHQLGGYRYQAKSADAARRLMDDARRMEDAGASALLLEAVPSEVGRLVSERTSLPVIGCVSGPCCDGQVVVMHDILGYGGGHPPSAVKIYADLSRTLCDAFGAYIRDVRDGVFPDPVESVSLDDAESQRLEMMLQPRRERSEV